MIVIVNRKEKKVWTGHEWSDKISEAEGYGANVHEVALKVSRKTNMATCVMYADEARKIYGIKE